ncbi:amidase [Thozetella sp. PMI_491]|nr:amidase [Thozetella sp. PMI_491]
MASISSEALWVPIARRKQTERDARIPPQWRIPSSHLPKDPPHFEDGPQSVLDVPSKILSREEIEITEDYTAAALLEAISHKRLSVERVIDAFCHRAAVAHQLTNCLTEPLFTQAAERARFLDRYLEEHGTTLGPLHGLPVSVKDTFDIKGVDSSIGLAALCFKPADKNAPLVDLLLSLGAIIVAKTNVPQTLSSLDSINNVFGRTMNPVNRLCTAGGSSGGEGVLVAMKGSLVGIGTDLGGSVRIPAMTNGIYGFKPSNSRLPYEGQAVLVTEGMTRLGVQPVAGPLARSIEDINFVMKELVPRASLWGGDCAFGEWDCAQGPLRGAGPSGEVVIGVLRCDGNCTLLPPVDRILSEVASSLNQHPNINVVEVPTPPTWAQSQSVMSKLISIDGAVLMGELLESMQEPLVPWMQSRFRTSKPCQLTEVAQLQARRAELEHDMLQIWAEVDKFGRRTRKLDAIICPVAPHPVPEIDRYITTGYTSSFVMFDYPAGTIPIRDVVEQDLHLGQPLGGESLGSWDDQCRKLWDEKTVKRRVYLGTPLSIQVVVPRLEDEKLGKVMALVDAVVKGRSTSSKLQLPG